MIRCQLLYFTIVFFAACSGSGKLYGPASPDFTALNTDSSFACQFIKMTNNSFQHTLVTKDGFTEKRESYTGTIKDSPDTIFLSYHKNLQPKGAANYLV